MNDYTRSAAESKGQRGKKFSRVRWEEILPNFPGYWISNDGRAIGRRGHELSPGNSNGYLIIVALSQDGKRINMRINRLVCWYHNGPWPDDGEVYHAAHLDCNPFNNNWWNLEWQTQIVNSNNPITITRHSAARRLQWQDPSYRAIPRNVGWRSL
jgi:hypothetical protein